MARTWPKKFHERYCGRDEGAYGGYDVDGATELAFSELPMRLGMLILQRSYKECWGKDAPPKIRSINWIDVSDELPEQMKKPVRAWTDAEFAKESDQILHKKLDAIIDDLMQGLVLGQKRVLWAKERSGVEILAQAFDAASRERSWRVALKQRCFEVFATHGETKDRERIALAAEFRKHQGCAVFIATIDSLPEAASLAGASGCDYAQLHHEAGALYQSENRAYHPEVGSLPIVYHVGKGTFEERMILDLRPKVEVIAKVHGAQDATGLLSLLESQKKETIEEYQARLFSGMPEQSNGVSFGEFDPPDSDAAESED